MTRINSNDESQRYWRRCKNVSGEIIPAHAVVRIKKYVADGNYYEIEQVKRSNSTIGIGFTNAVTIEIDETGEFTREMPALAAVSVGDAAGSSGSGPEFGIGTGSDHDETTWGTVAGSWYISPSGFGLRALSGYLCPDSNSGDCLQAIMVIEDDGMGGRDDDEGSDGSSGSGGSGSGATTCPPGTIRVTLCDDEGNPMDPACLSTPNGQLIVTDFDGNIIPAE